MAIISKKISNIGGGTGVRIVTNGTDTVPASAEGFVIVLTHICCVINMSGASATIHGQAFPAGTWRFDYDVSSELPIGSTVDTGDAIGAADCVVSYNGYITGTAV